MPCVFLFLKLAHWVPIARLQRSTKLPAHVNRKLIIVINQLHICHALSILYAEYQLIGFCRYRYQLPLGQPNHTCGGANIWADVGSSSEVFCSAGSYCPTSIDKISCTSGYDPYPHSDSIWLSF